MTTESWDGITERRKAPRPVEKLKDTTRQMIEAGDVPSENMMHPDVVKENILELSDTGWAIVRKMRANEATQEDCDNSELISYALATYLNCYNAYDSLNGLSDLTIWFAYRVIDALEDCRPYKGCV